MAAIILISTKGAWRDAAIFCNILLHEPTLDLNPDAKVTDPLTLGYIDFLLRNNNVADDADIFFIVNGIHYSRTKEELQNYKNELSALKSEHMRIVTLSSHFNNSDVQKMYEYGDVVFNSGAEAYWAGLVDSVEGVLPDSFLRNHAKTEFCNRYQSLDLDICG